MPGKKKSKKRKPVRRIRTADLPPPVTESVLDLYCGLPFATWRKFCLTQYTRAIDKENKNRHKDSEAVIESRRVDCEIIKAAVMGKVIGQATNGLHIIPEITDAELMPCIAGLLEEHKDVIDGREPTVRFEPAATHDGEASAPGRQFGSAVAGT